MWRTCSTDGWSDDVGSGRPVTFWWAPSFLTAIRLRHSLTCTIFFLIFAIWSPFSLLLFLSLPCLSISLFLYLALSCSLLLSFSPSLLCCLSPSLSFCVSVSPSLLSFWGFMHFFVVQIHAWQFFSLMARFLSSSLSKCQYLIKRGASFICCEPIPWLPHASIVASLVYLWGWMEGGGGGVSISIPPNACLPQ